MHLCQHSFQSSKHLLNSISGIAFKAFFDSDCISSIVSKRCPRSRLLSLGNSQKSHWAKSGEYGSCGTICVEFLTKWSRRTSAVWDGALLWCKNHELSAHNIFWNGVECERVRYSPFINFNNVCGPKGMEKIGRRFQWIITVFICIDYTDRELLLWLWVLFRPPVAH